MAYAAVCDLVTRFGSRELIQLTDRSTPPAEQIDQAVADVALNSASTLADGYIAVKYALPLLTNPPLLVDLVCDMARYRLYGDQVTELVTARNDKALAQLKLIAEGKIKIDAGPIEPASRPTVILAQSDKRIFTRRSERAE